MQRVVVLLLVAACSSNPADPYFVQIGSPGQANVLSRLELFADHPWSVLDPTLDEFEPVALEFVASGHSATSTCSVAVRRGELEDTLEANLVDDRCIATWDGTFDSQVANVGPVDFVATLTRDGERVEAHSFANVIRVGFAELQLDGDGRVGLVYRALDGVRYGYYAVDASVAPWRNLPAAGDEGTPLSLVDGSRRAVPAPWDDLTSPPLDPSDAEGVERDAYNLPVGWVSGAAIEGRSSWIVEGDLGDVELRVVSDVSIDDVAVVDGGFFDFIATDWVPGVGRFDVPLELGFEARVDDEWVRLPGVLRTVHRIYGFTDHPEFDYDDDAHRPWVDVVDRIADWVGGTTADPDEVGAAIVEGVFYELGLQYDNQRGASHYTSYPSGTWGGAAFNLSRFQDLADGNIVNCSDAASIVSTYANMIGLDFRYHIIQHQFDGGFELNYLHAIGRDWGASPFVSGRRSFRYHAVVGPADTRIFDSTLALDGDGDPGSAPHELLLVQGLSEMDYLVGLSPEWDRVRVFIDDQVRVR